MLDIQQRFEYVCYDFVRKNSADFYDDKQNGIQIINNYAKR